MTRSPRRSGEAGSEHNMISFAPIIIMLLGICCLSACDLLGTNDPEMVSYPGRWTGWMSIGENESGYNTTVIKKDRYCSIYGEISGNKIGWGDFQLTVEGEGYVLMGGDLIGDVIITVVMNGTDTLVTDGSWGGRFDQEIPVGWGAWFTLPNGAFMVDGKWMAQKENSAGVSLNLMGY